MSYWGYVWNDMMEIWMKNTFVRQIFVFDFCIDVALYDAYVM